MGQSDPEEEGKVSEEERQGSLRTGHKEHKHLALSSMTTEGEEMQSLEAEPGSS